VNRTVSIVLAGLLGLCVYVGAVAWWFETEVSDPDTFVASTSAALSSEESRDALGQLIVDRLTEEYPILLIVESRLVELSSSLLETENLRSAVALISENIHGRIISGQTGAIVIDLGPYKDDILAPIESIFPELAALVPEAWFESVEILASGSLPDLSAAHTRAPLAKNLALGGAVLLILALLWRSGSRRRNVALIGGAVMLGGAVSGLLVPVSRWRLVGSIGDDPSQVLYANVYNGFTTSLLRNAIVLALFGAVILAGAVLVPREAPTDETERLRVQT